MFTCFLTWVIPLLNPEYFAHYTGYLLNYTEHMINWMLWHVGLHSSILSEVSKAVDNCANISTVGQL